MTTVVVEKPKRVGRPRMDSIRAEIEQLKATIGGLKNVDIEQAQGIFKRLAALETKLDSIIQGVREDLRKEIDARFNNKKEASVEKKPLAPEMEDNEWI